VGYDTQSTRYDNDLIKIYRGCFNGSNAQKLISASALLQTPWGTLLLIQKDNFATGWKVKRGEDLACQLNNLTTE